IKIHSLQLVAALENSQQRQVEKAQMQYYLTQTQQLNQEMGDFIATQPTWLAARPSNLKTLLNDYTLSLEIYTQQIESILNNQELESLQPEDIEKLRKELQNIFQSQEVIKQNYFYKRLLYLIEIAQSQELLGGVAMEEAQGLEKLIIVLSTLVSIAIASIIALRATIAIARPIEEITNTAQRVTSESNFDLRVISMSDDEIGVLANSLNQLIEWVGSYVQQLEHSRQTLEQGVKERTT
ncbi:MAG: HAMP domain-containing protein, partial [Cyanobacteriota bacterium]|nr:HAMP domain-containing protein [Cyanobacteriota bacterium]